MRHDPNQMERITPAFFGRDAVSVAEALIGVILEVNGIGGKIVETEAYGREDPASHSYVGKTARNNAMFGPAGTAYVYRSYGLHWCLNFVCENASAVLLRAIEPQTGLGTMRIRRGTARETVLCAGPGRLCQALGVTRHLDGRSLFAAPFYLTVGEGETDVCRGPRIGVTRAADVRWRFGAQGSAFLSHPFPDPVPV
ncbi:DNA-3-methyladenine glycosylase [Ensifer sp. ENS03]|jgi:DNA-3-methyladenine glycosylase|uniref:DNA-3-methyladenine glycosylase n=2 Tax=Sinorhizobium/Ensifer group TaxID=227292 RepID=UPI000D878516